MRHLFSAAAILLTVAILSSDAFAADLQAGKSKVQAVCQTCHGLDGRSTIAGSPNLSGQNEDYIMIQLKAYRAGERQHPQMSIIAQTLSDDDIDNVAKWYSSIKITVELPE
ncbi:MAG: cytochrome c [Gammaproteobacteria bacterium]|nr:cytochrome c [Gammaproteobacteria bacterium]